MGNKLDLFRGKVASATQKGKNLVSVFSVGPIATPLPQRQGYNNTQSKLPHAAAIYGAAAAVFAVIAVYYLFTGAWVTGLIMIVPTFCLAGFSYYYIKP